MKQPPAKIAAAPQSSV